MSTWMWEDMDSFGDSQPDYDQRLYLASMQPIFPFFFGTKTIKMQLYQSLNTNLNQNIWIYKTFKLFKEMLQSRIGLKEFEFFIFFLILTTDILDIMRKMLISLRRVYSS